MIAFAFLLLIVGLLNTFAPIVGWYASIGWKLKDAEPSDGYLVMTRIGGVIAIIVAVIIFISAASSAATGSNVESRIRDSLKNNQITEISSFGLQFAPAYGEGESAEWFELRQIILDADMQKPSIDYNDQATFGYMGSIDLVLSDGERMTVYQMNEFNYGIGRGNNYPEITFSSASLSNWIEEHRLVE